jgi:catechol 2,3-dioxygenase-like lactoylglutathione lyase family enzyme
VPAPPYFSQVTVTDPHVGQGTCQGLSRARAKRPRRDRDGGRRCQTQNQEGVTNVDMKLEVVLLPVSDVDRAKDFYKGLDWRLDADFAPGQDFRIVQLTPPGSECSIIMGSGITSALPGSVQGLQLTVTDIDAACAELRNSGIDVDGPFHDVDNVFHRIGTDGRVQGADPDHRSYISFASFSDPDGNGWLLQEVKQRAPGR